MKNKSLHALLQPTILAALLVALSFSPTGVKAQTGYYGPYFIFTDTSSASVYAFIDNAATNGDASVQLQVTPNWGIISDVYDSFAIGVWFDTAFNEAAVYNEKNTSGLQGSAFNVLVPNSHGTSFLQVATNSNISSAASYIDDPLINDNPDAIIFVTHNWNPDTSANYENEVQVPTGVFYDNGVSEWSVFNEDASAFVPNTAFNVFVPNAGNNVFTVTATPSNTGGSYILYMDNAVTNNDSNAILIVTQDWNPNGNLSGVYNNHPIGVWYDGTEWTIFNEDIDTIATGASFNVLVAGDKSPTGIKPIASLNASFTVYPNPASATVNLQLPQAYTSNTQIDVFNLLGQNIYNLPQNSNNTLSIDVSQWPEGAYYVRAINGNTTYTKNFIVARH